MHRRRSRSQTEAWAGDVKQFLRTDSVQAALRQAFEASNSAVDGALLKEYDRWDCPSGKSFARYLHDAQNWHRLDQIQLDERLKDHAQRRASLGGGGCLPPPGQRNRQKPEQDRGVVPDTG